MSDATRTSSQLSNSTPIEAGLHESWMRQAIALAQRAADAGEAPIGCIIVHLPTGQIVGQGFNQRETDEDPTAHAEIVAMRQAGRHFQHWRLLDCALIVTLEPCPMCAGAIVNARLPVLVYGCDDPKAGAVRTLYRICDDVRLNHRVQVVPGVLADACAEVLKTFFRARRAGSSKESDEIVE